MEEVRRARRGPQCHARRRRRATRHRRSPRVVGAARVPRGRVARHRGARVARARARRAAVVAARVARCSASPSTSRRAVCASRAPGSSSRSRSGSWPRPTSSPPACSMPSPCSASSASTAPCARCRARSRSSTRSPRRGTPIDHRAAGERRRSRAGRATCTCAPPATLVELRACLKGEEEWPTWDDGALAADDHDAASDDEPVDLREVRGLAFARRALEVAAAGSPPPALRRATGNRQDDAGATPRHDAPAARAPRSARGHPHPLRRRRGDRRAPAHVQTVPGPAPHRVHRFARRRRQQPATAGRGHARPPGTAVPRRARRVRAHRARRAPTTPGGTRRAHLATTRLAHVPGRRSSSSRARTRARAASASRTAGAASRNGCDTGAG